MSESTKIPRWSVAGCSGFVGFALAWAAYMLPWQSWTTFAFVTAVVAAAHGAVAVLSILGHPLRGPAWRVQGLLALAYLAWLTFNLFRSAIYVAEVYGSLGQGVGAALLLIWAAVALFLLPTSLWALAKTGGWRRTRRGTGAAAVGVLLAGLALARTAAAGSLDEVIPERGDTLREQVEAALPDPQQLQIVPDGAPGLMVRSAVECEATPGPGRPTVVATFLERVADDEAEATSVCRQGSTLAEALAGVRETLSAKALAGPIKIDVVLATSRMRSVLPIIDSLALRPALDGVCEGTRCLMAWQLVAVDAFTRNQPFKRIPDFRFGVEPMDLRAKLLWPDTPEQPAFEMDGLVRIVTASFVRDVQGFRTLYRGRPPGPEPTPEALAQAVADAENYIARAQRKDGRFDYIVMPYTGQVKMRGFSLARQAGTSLVTCELFGDRKRAKKVARKALQMLVETARYDDDLAMLAYPKGKTIKKVNMGHTALSTIALLSCRDLVGTRFDRDIAGMVRFLLAMQRPDGGFNPKYDLEGGAPIPGPDPLFAVGQAVYALSLAERLALEHDVPGLPDAQTLREATQRGMDHTTKGYWNFFGRDFFWLEENWHCLAARASLGHHRDDAYERFCLDYVRFKTRLQLTEDSGVEPDVVGSYGFSNLSPPHYTATAGLGEAAAAAGAIGRARGEDITIYEEALRGVVAFLVHHQHRDKGCFACAADRTIVGAFSEHAASSQIRIDYVQHAMAAMGHGGRILGMLPGDSAPVPLSGGGGGAP